MTKNAACHLCRNMSELQNSHIWSKFGYKRYVSNQEKGGSFVDLMESRKHNKQKTDKWFCKECEQQFEEGYAANVLRQIEETP